MQQNVTFDITEFTNLLVDTILDKKGSDILLLDMTEQTLFADYFLLCNGENKRQLRALVDNVIKESKQQAREIPIGVEGNPEDGWLLIDFGFIVVHVFDPDVRAFYDLEELWHEAQVVLRIQ